MPEEDSESSSDSSVSEAESMMARGGAICPDLGEGDGDGDGVVAGNGDRVVFLAEAAFLAAAFLAAGFSAAGFFATGLFAAGFFATAFLAGTFF